jgi:hypothetical protein
MATAFVDESHQLLFESHFHKHATEKAHKMIPPRDTTNSRGSILFEAPLRKILLEKITSLVHAIQVAQSAGVLVGCDSKSIKSKKDMEDFAKDIVSKLAESLYKSSSTGSFWMRGIEALYSQFISKIINAIVLIFEGNPADQCTGLAEIASTTAALINEVIAREIYSKDAIKKAMEQSQLDGFMMMVNVALDFGNAPSSTITVPL